MHRRDLVALLGVGTTASLLSPLSATERLELGRLVHARAGQTPVVFTPAERDLVTRVADLVLPRTDTPGALDVEVPRFIEAMLAGWYSPEERADFRQGLAAIDRLAGAGGFGTRSEGDQVALLRTLDGQPSPKGSATGTFRTLKSLTVHGYFTSELVQTRVLTHPVIPGRFDGCVPVAGR